MLDSTQVRFLRIKLPVPAQSQSGMQLIPVFGRQSVYQNTRRRQTPPGLSFLQCRRRLFVF